MYDNGEGVPMDDVQAYAWLRVAATQGNERAKELIALLIMDMTPGDITKAQVLSKDYWKAYGHAQQTE